MAVPGGVIADGIVGATPTEVTISGNSQGGLTWLVTEGATSVEGTMNGSNWTTLTGDTVAGTIERFNVIGLTKVRITGNGTYFRVVA